MESPCECGIEPSGSINVQIYVVMCVQCSSMSCVVLTSEFHSELHFQGHGEDVQEGFSGIPSYFDKVLEEIADFGPVSFLLEPNEK